MPQDGPGSYTYWKAQIEQSKQFVLEISTNRNWDQNNQAYLGKGLGSMPVKDTVVVNKDYALVEGKKAQLFFQAPDVSATASSPLYEQAAPLVAAVVTDQLRRMNSLAMVDEALVDVLCPAGIAVTVIGYEAFTDPQEPEMMVPAAMNPLTPQLGPDGQPVLMPKIVREKYFWERVSPKRFLFPKTFIGSDWDKASWLGYTFDLDKVVAERLFKLTPEEVTDSAAVPNPERNLLSSDLTKTNASDANDKIEFTAIWLRASDIDPMIGDPEIYRQLVLMDGKEQPIVYRDSPYQTISNGRMINGLRGNPIHPLTLRYASDVAIPPSDCSMSRQQVDEMSLGRTQMIQQRNRAVPIVTADSSRLPKEAIEKITRGEVQEIIIVTSNDAANPAIQEVRRAQWPRENFAFNDVINRDISEQWAFGSNQLGVDTETKRTATELSLMDSATRDRMDRDRAKVLAWYGKGAQKVLALVQMFADEQQFVRVARPDGIMALQQWDKTAIAGEYDIVLAPDSSKRVDAVSEKKLAVDVFKMFGNDPLIDPVKLRKTTLRKLGLPEDMVLQPKPKPPEQPQISASFNGEDLNPMMPQYANVATLLSAAGIGLAPPTPQPMPPGPPQTNPGPVPPVTEIGKRTDERLTGKLPGAGQAAQVGR